MKAQHLLYALLASVIEGSPITLTKKSSGSSNDLNLPSGGMEGYNGVAWGWFPDDDSSFTSMSTINGWTGKKASTYGTYAHVDDSGSFVNEMQTPMQDVIASGAVWVASVMPTISGGFNAVDDAHCQKIASIIQQYVNSGVEVWLRFGHEMNWYTQSAASPRYYGSESNVVMFRERPRRIVYVCDEARDRIAASDFIAMWQRMHNALANINGQGKVLMFWSPNDYGSSGVASLDQWYPGDNYVDIVGLDVYLQSGYTSFAAVYGDFYNRYAKGHNKHFAIGETGTRTSDVGSKEAWVKALANTDVSAFPFYKSCSWFEYIKADVGEPTVDHRLIIGQTAATIEETLSNFA